MDSDRPTWPEGNGPGRLDGDVMTFRHAARFEPGGVLLWTVWCRNGDRLVRADATTATQAMDRAIALALADQRAERLSP